MFTLVSEGGRRPAPNRLGGLPYLATSEVRTSVELKRHTTLHIGGKADCFIEVGSIEDLKRTLLFAAEWELPTMILGGGSNVVFSDVGFRGLVLSLRRGFDWVTVNGDILEAGAGTQLAKVVQESYRNGLSGFEFALGIPGSIGGALLSNAGTYVGEIASVVESVYTVDSMGLERIVSREEAGFQYRGSKMKGLTIVSAKFRVKPEPGACIFKRMNELRVHRNKTQPRGRSAGCVWKNGPDYSAGQVLDSLGFKGRKIGGAFVSPRHANFIINDGAATSADYRGLMAEMAERAKKERGIDLEPEVVCVGPD